MQRGGGGGEVRGGMREEPSTMSVSGVQNQPCPLPQPTLLHTLLQASDPFTIPVGGLHIPCAAHPTSHNSPHLVVCLGSLHHAGEWVTEPVTELVVRGEDRGHEEVHEAPQLH